VTSTTMPWVSIWVFTSFRKEVAAAASHAYTMAGEAVRGPYVAAHR